MLQLRTILRVVRPALLPTVWSNCLAGWWLGGAGHLTHLPPLFLGATLLYLGGAFLNDAFDADYDRQNDPSRPIPSGAASELKFWRVGVGFLVAGALFLLGGGFVSGLLGLVLVCLVILYSAVQRIVPVGPFLHAMLRLGLYLLGASMAERGLSGWSIWCGTAAGIYVIGLECFARTWQKPGPRRYWPLLLLTVPVALALVMDVGAYRETGLLLSAVLILWSLRSLRQTLWSLEPILPSTVSGLVAGLVFVDWLATCPANFVSHINHASQQVSVAFLVLFGLTLLLQKPGSWARERRG